MNASSFYQLQDNEFIVTVSYPYKAHDMRQLNLKQHEKIKVIQVHESGWWIGENLAGDVGLFPSNYVSRLVSIPLSFLVPLLPSTASALLNIVSIVPLEC